MGAPAKPSRAAAVPELVQRILSGLVLMAVALVASFSGGLVFVLAFAVLGLLVLNEWERLTGLSSPRRLILGMAAILAAAAIAHLVGPLEAIAIATILTFAALTAALLENERRWSLTGTAYASWLVVSLVSLRGNDEIGLIAILFVFAVVWATDTFAYFGGRAFGGPKLLPGVSPKKTWSGAVSGVVAAVIMALSLLLLAQSMGSTPAILTPRAADLAWMGALAALLSIAAQAGDLFESALKRKFGKKDSGRLLPGHGGIMDRVDGLVFASAAAFLFGLSTKGVDSVASGLLGLHGF